jgi:hypothetical protein
MDIVLKGDMDGIEAAAAIRSRAAAAWLSRRTLRKSDWAGVPTMRTVSTLPITHCMEC